jgi:antirestriction protein ArdC
MTRTATTRKSAQTDTSRTDVYTRVTDTILSQLEQGVRPWMKPWQAGHSAGHVSKPLRANGQHYNGINVLMLWAQSMISGFEAPIWMTYKQAQELGGNVKKGEKGSLVVYANTFRKEEANDKGETVERDIPFMKGYTVFNVEQVEGLPAHFYAKNQPEVLNTAERLEVVETFVQNTKAIVQHGGASAFFSPSKDLIQMPDYAQFSSREGYYATLVHELTHWSGAESRLNRDMSGRFKTAAYAAEELIAEMGAAFLCADLGITPEIREDHAAYLQSWLTVLKDDKKAIFTAAAHAQRALDYLHYLQAEPSAS